jgi:hypothetical protein
MIYPGNNLSRKANKPLGAPDGLSLAAFLPT